MTPMSAPASPIVMNFRRLGQPHVQIAGAEMNGSIFDAAWSANEADFWQRGDEIGFQPHDLKRILPRSRRVL